MVALQIIKVKGIFGKYIEKLPSCLNELNIGGYRYF